MNTLKNLTLVLLICLSLQLNSQSVTWNNQPNPLEFKTGETLSINTTYNLNGSTLNYIWIKLQRLSVTNSVVEEFTGVFYNGSNTNPDTDTVNLSYVIPENIPTSSELTNGDYYKLFFAMWTSNGWTGLDLLPTIIDNSQSTQTVTNIVANFNVNHIIGNSSEFDRSKFITIHASQDENEWDGNIQINDLRDDFLNTYDVYMGRNTGGISWHLSQLNQDSNNPGFVDANQLRNRAPYWRNLYGNNTDIHQYESRNKLIIAGQLHPFWTGDGQQATGQGWKFANATATGDYMGLYIKEFHSQNGQPKPAFIEVINEPAWKRLGGTSDFSNNIQDIAEFHNDVADAIKVHLPDAKVGGYTTAFPNFEKGNFQRWNNRWKLFMDVAGEKMDFWSIHLYDWPSINNGRKEFRSGSNLEATFDMMEQYSMMKFGVAKPFVISEYGAQMHDFQNDQWSSYRDWLHIRSSCSMLMSFMDRPNLIASAINFLIVKAEWGFADGVPYNHRLMRKANEPDSYTGDWVYSDMVKFYQLWSDVKGKRIDTTSDNLDVQVDGFVDGDKAYVILNNLNFVDETIQLKTLGFNSNTINNINKKHVYSDGTNTILEYESLPINTDSVTLKSEATIVLTYTFDSSISVDETSTETKYYAPEYLKPITANQSTSFAINNVQKTTYGEAILRVGIGRPHNLSLKPAIILNGKNIEVPDNWRGDNQAQKESFFGLLEIPVSFDDLHENNQISITFGDTGGHISSVTMQVYNFSTDIRNGTLSTQNRTTYKRIEVYPNPTTGIVHISENYNYNKIDVYDIRGKKLISFINNEEINIQNLSKGVYFLKTDNKFITKVIKN